MADKKRGQERATKGATLFYIFHLRKEGLAYAHKAYHFPVSTEESRLQMGLEMYQRLPEGADYSNFLGPFSVDECLLSKSELVTRLIE